MDKLYKVSVSTLFAFFIVIIFSFPTWSQTGPAGIGTGDGSSGPRNVLWLSTDFGITETAGKVSSWADQSGNGFNASQPTVGFQPDYTAANPNLNNRPTLNFGGSNGFFSIADNALLDDTDGLTALFVFRTANLGTQGILSKRVADNNQQAYVFFTGGGNFNARIIGDQGSDTQSSNLTNNTNYIISTIFDGSIQSISNFSNTANAGSQTGASNFLNDNASDLFIGNFNLGDNRNFTGDIAEIILYRDALNAAERLIVENYLAEKYALNITNDIFGQYIDYNANYFNDFRAIGTSNGTIKKSVSGFSNAFQIREANNGLNTNLEFFAIGHNDAVAHSNGVTVDLGANITSRWAKDFYLENSQNNVVDDGESDMDLIFDFGTAGFSIGSPSNYVLIYRADNASNYETVFANSYSIENGNQLVVSVPGNRIKSGYYTIGIGAQQLSRTWYVLKNGNWNDPDTWTLDAGIAPTPNNPGNQIPSVEDNVIIRNGRTVTVQPTTNNINIASLRVDGRINLRTSTGHDFKVINGKGTIDIEGNSGVSNFPLGNTTGSNGFANELNGGLLIVSGTGLEFNQNLILKDLRVDLSNPSDLVILGANLTLNGDFTIRKGTWQFGNNAAVARQFTVFGNALVQNNGSTQNGRITTSTQNVRHSFNLYGDFINDGDARFSQRITQTIDSDPNNGITDFYILSENRNQSIRANGPTYFLKVIIDKGDPAYSATFTASQASNFVLTGRANANIGGDVNVPNDNQNAFGLISGTAVLGTNINVNPLNNTGNYSIGTNAKLLIDGGFARKFGGDAVTPYGQIEVNAGTLQIESSSGITSRGAGLLKVNGGTVNMPQFRTSIFGASNVGGLEITGGTVNIGRTNGVNPGNGNYYTLSLTYSDNAFIMTGGELNVSDATGRGLVFINSSQNNINVSGGQVNLFRTNTNLAKITSIAPFFNLNLNNSDNSTNANAKFAVVTGESGSGVDGRTISNPDLKVLNNLILEESTTRTTGGNVYGTYLDFCDTGNCNDLFVGRDLRIEDNAVLDIWSGNANNAGSSTVTFNSNNAGVLYIGNITTYNDDFVNYTTPNDAYERWEFPFYNLIIDKPNSTLSLAAKLPGKGGFPTTSNRVNSNGGKNVTAFASQLLQVANDFQLLNGTLSQIDPFNTVVVTQSGGATYGSVGDPVGYSIRLLGANVVNNGTLFVYEDGVTPKEGIIVTREGEITLTTSEGASFGNLRLQNANDVVSISSDISVGRLEFIEGLMDIGTYNLKVDVFEFLPLNTPLVSSARIFNATNMVRMAGNASDGGLSIKVPRSITAIPNRDEFESLNTNDRENWARPYNQSDRIWFPIGSNTQYTPAVCHLHSSGTTSGDEYITVKVVNSELQTTDLSGGDLLSYYWNVDFEGFAAGEEPIVSWMFQYAETSVVGDESNYVPGKVLDGGTYTRSTEGGTNAVKNGGAAGNQGDILGNDPRNIIIFNGVGTNAAPVGVDNISSSTPAVYAGASINPQWQTAWPNAGLVLENANYTAGASNRFIGAPRIYYSRLPNGSDWYNRNWTNGNYWSLSPHDGATNNDSRPAAGAFPQTGDIAVIGFGGFTGGIAPRHSIQLNNNDDINVAEIIFNHPSNNGNRLVLNRNATLSFSKISGTGGTFMERPNNPGESATITGDFGEFFTNNNFVYNYFLNGNGTYNIVPPTNIFPNLRVEGGNNSRIAIFQTDIITNGNLIVDGNTVIRTNNGSEGDFLIKGDLRIGGYLGGNFEFNDAASRSVEANRIRFIGEGNSNLTVRNNSQNSIIHRLVVKDNIEQDRPGNFDLFNGLGSDNNAILEFQGLGNHSYVKTGGNTADFYRLIMNKGNDQAASFELGQEFNIPNATATFQPIEILNGTLIINTPDINGGTGITLANESNFLLPNINNPEASSGSGSLELRDGNFLIQGNNAGLLLDGTLTISGGTLDMASGAGNGNNFIEYSVSGNAEINITDGVLNVGSQVRRGLLSTSGVLKYTQSGGVARFGVRTAPQQNRGVFEVLNTGSVFNHSGGDFIIERQNGSATTASLRLEPDSYDFTGSTITIGGIATPAGQNQIGINATVPLNNLLITGNNNLNAKTFINPLTVNDLQIENNGTFSANGLDLTVINDLEVNGSFNNQGDGTNQQTTFFNATGTQNISGTGTIEFWNVEKTGNGTLNLDHDVTVENNLNILNGILNTTTNALNLEGDLIHDGEHQSAVAGPGIVFNGTATQNIARSNTGQSVFGTISIDNNNGVEVTAGQNDFEINHKVILAAGVFDIGSNLLIMDEDAIFENGSGGTAVSDFNVNNMITVNTSLIDKGVRKIYPENFNGSFVYPVGLLNYTPAVVNATDVDGNGFITIKPIDNFSDGITDDDDETCTGGADYDDTQNVLQYYWLVKSANITNFDGSFTMYHVDALEAVNNAEGLGLNNYAPARLLNADDTWDKNYTEQLFDEVGNTITFQSDLSNDYSGLNSVSIEGRYTAGITRDDSDDLLCGSAIPNVVPLFETLSIVSDGNVNIGGSYEGGAAPSIGQSPDLVVKGNFTLVLNDNFRRFRKVTIEENATLEVNATFGHNLGTIEGNGTLKLVDDGSFPAGDYEGFFPDANCSDGGGLEYENNNTGNDVTVLAEGFTNLKRLILSGNGKKIMSNGVSINICENLEMRGGDFEMSNNSELRVKGNVIKNGGSNFNAEFTNATVVLDGTGNQTISGQFTGLEAFNILEVNKTNGRLSVIDAGNNDVTVSGHLRFTNGLINTNTTNSLILVESATISGEKTSSHVNGPLIRNLNASTASQFDKFPVGQEGRYGLIELSFVQTTDSWTATFFDESPEENPAIATLANNLGGDNPVVSANQYWELTSAASNMANVRIHWDPSSNIADSTLVPVNQALSELRVVRFKQGTSTQWEDQGGQNVSGNENNGQLTSFERIDFSTNFITFGAGEANNNSLPVELTYFRANNSRRSVDLEWQTASEFNNDFFEVQRSFDGKEFEVIGIVEGNGTINETINYDFSDYSPLAGDSYYRLRQVDFNGDFEYSPVAKVTRVEETNLMLVPNPTITQDINLKLSGFHGEQKIYVKIYDVTGKLFYSGVHAPIEIQQKALPVRTEMHPGIYMVEVVQGNTKKQVRLAIR